MQPNSADFDQDISGVQKTPGVYILWDGETPLHLSWSSNLQRRLKRLLVAPSAGPAGATRRFADKIESLTYWPVGSRLETQILLYRLAKRFYPEKYLKLLKLRFPWFLNLTAKDPFPRLEIANRLPGRSELLLGPFVGKGTAAHYEQETTALFQLRRCTETLLPSPDHPGCIYGEMNQCLRPCQCAVTAEEYDSEVQRVSEFLATNGRSSSVLLSSARDRACEEMDFEQAAQLHKRIEKIRETAGLRDPVVAEIPTFNGVALTRAASPDGLLLWPMLAGCWQAPVSLDFLRNESTTKSLDGELRELLASALRQPDVAPVQPSNSQPSNSQAEQLAIFSRWYYSSWRDGEWFPFRELPDLNYRKLVREISKMAQAPATQSH